jgi:hypothetical protein
MRGIFILASFVVFTSSVASAQGGSLSALRFLAGEWQAIETG